MKNIINTISLFLIVSVSSFAQKDSTKCANFKASIKNSINQSGGINVESNGEIDLHIVGGTKPYSINFLNTTPKDPVINWNGNNPFGNPNAPVVCTFYAPCDSIIKGLSPGTYNFFITDSSGCSASLDANIGKTNVINCSKLNADFTNIINPTDKNGKISVWGRGGGYPYKYLWNNNSTANTIENLTAGIYSVTITDTNNCKATFNYELTKDTTVCDSFQIEKYKIRNPTNSNGEISIGLKGGQHPYKITWLKDDYLFQFDNLNLTNLEQGKYTVTVIDSNNCSRKLSIPLILDTITCKEFKVSISNIKNQDFHFYEANGSVEFNVSGGKKPYTSSTLIVEDYYNTSMKLSLSKYTHLSPSNYKITFFDSNLCQQDIEFKIGYDTTLCSNLSMQITNLKVKEVNNQLVIDLLKFEAKGGVAPYDYSWQSNSNNGSSNAIVDLNLFQENNLFLVVYDSIGCYAEINKSFQFDSTICSKLNVEFDANLTTSTSDYSNCTGVLALNIESEFAGLDILWNNYSNESKIENVCPGTYSVVVMDSNNCIKTLSKTISLEEKSASISSLNEKQIKVYPNPCNDNLFVEFNNHSGEFEIIDFVGNQIMKQTYSNQSNLKVDASLLKSGTYILRLKNEFETTNHIFEKY